MAVDVLFEVWHATVADLDGVKNMLLKILCLRCFSFLFVFQVVFCFLIAFLIASLGARYIYYIYIYDIIEHK